MARADFELDISRFDEGISVIDKAGKNLSQAINESMSEFASDEIEKNIINILPVGSKDWRGKLPHAASVNPFRHDLIKLGTIVRTKTEYNYLYFPDDGSNTVKHAGNKRFMLKGAEDSADKIISDIKNRFFEK